MRKILFTSFIITSLLVFPSVSSNTLDVKKRIQILEDKIMALKARTNSYETGKLLTQKIETELLQTEKKISEEIRKIENKVESLEEELSSSKESLEKLEENIGVRRSYLEKIQHELSLVNDRIHEKRTDFFSYKNKLGQIEKRRQEVTAKLAHFKNQLSYLSREIIKTKRLYAQQNLKLDRELKKYDEDLLKAQFHVLKVYNRWKQLSVGN